MHLNFRHFFVCQLKVEDVHVVLLVVEPWSLRDHHVFALDAPSQHYLDYGFAVLLAQALEVGVYTQVGGFLGDEALRSVEVARSEAWTGDWAVSHRHDPSVQQGLDQLLLGILWVQLHLVHSWLDLAVSQEVPEQLSVEVRHSDRLREALCD